MRKAARLLQGSLKQLERGWPEIETKLSFQQTPARTQLQGPGHPHSVPNPAQLNTASAAGTSGLSRRAGGQSRLAFLTRTLQQPPRSPGAALALQSPHAIHGIGPFPCKLPPLLDMQSTEALAGRFCLQLEPQ